MTDYFISSTHGDDSAAGTSPTTAWRTLARAAGAAPGPGDAILLERGSRFDGEALHLDGVSGSAQQPVTIGGYGDPELPPPLIACDGNGRWFEDYRAPIGGSPHRSSGTVSTALLLRDCSYVHVHDLEITNRRIDDADGLAYNDLDVMDRTGVAVIAENGGTSRNISLERLFVHDVHGNIYDKHMANGGIYVIAHLPADPARVETDVARFDDIRIADNIVRDTSRWGIAVGYTAYLNIIDRGGRDADGNWDNTYDYGDGTIDDETIRRYGATNVVVEGNLVERAGGDAITVMYCDRPLVRHNVAREAAKDIRRDVYTATDNDRVAAAIWPWRCKHALFEYNEAYDTLNADRGNGDGQAWDADFGDGTEYRYNYSRNNSGGCVMFCNEKAVRSTFHHNVSDRDLMGAIDIPRNPDATVAHNTFIIAEDADPLRLDRADGAAVVEGNTFINAGREPKRTDWHPEGARITYSDNVVIGFANAPEDDAATRERPSRDNQC
ncbi:hypothetical protein CQR46_1071 [Bifidobacterium pseudolongum subsp. globosum]|uniref:Polyhydroxyalkanoate depolymerase n=1 Tax=Bifidobacterium pseudolongum subsp. globosum TaxID=1690 RepID=A0A2N3QGN9_9BIFI|nr:hypothetical protein [Bifidobacterium pseudolongum]PKU90428.1 hypothetical protein CQR46_1071 [Bifidobacterium pseudolongum subsp. globosum]